MGGLASSSLQGCWVVAVPPSATTTGGTVWGHECLAMLALLPFCLNTKSCQTVQVFSYEHKNFTILMDHYKFNSLIRSQDFLWEWMHTFSLAQLFNSKTVYIVLYPSDGTTFHTFWISAFGSKISRLYYLDCTMKLFGSIFIQSHLGSHYVTHPVCCIFPVRTMPWVPCQPMVRSDGIFFVIWG